MGIKRKASEKKISWLGRFWRWLTQNAGEETELPAPEPPKTIPPKASDYQPQGGLYNMLSQRSQRIAGNGGENAAMQVYDYCGVVFYKADIVYHYLNPGLDIRVGDRVLVPVSIQGVSQTAEGMVVSSGEYLAPCVPYPVSQASMIMQKL